MGRSISKGPFIDAHLIEKVEALNAAKLLLLFATVALVASAQRRAGPNDGMRLVWLLAAFSAARFVWGSTIRCQTITYLCLALWLWAFVAFERDARRWPLWLLPPVMAVWANCHGGFVVGLGLHGVLLATATWKARSRCWRNFRFVNRIILR